MRYMTALFVALLFIITCYFGLTGANIVYADDDFEKYQEHYEGYDHEDSPYEDFGELVGWGTVIIIGAAGLLFPVRRLTKTVVTNFPEFKKTYLWIVKNMGKYHVYIGLLALLLGSAHGIIMYISEGRLENEGMIGLISVVFMLIATLVGLVLNKKRKMKNLRITHLILVITTVVTGIVHIAFS